MSRAGVYTTMPPEELQRKITKAREAIANQKPRFLKCPYCKHNSIIVYGDTRGTSSPNAANADAQLSLMFSA